MKKGTILRDPNGTEWEVVETPHTAHSPTGRPYKRITIKRADGTHPDFRDYVAPDAYEVVR